MTENEAFYIIGNIPILSDDENYSICQYQEAKAVALEALIKQEKIKEAFTHYAFDIYRGCILSDYIGLISEIKNILNGELKE